ncbi:MAG TPA: hypothetical protein VMX75_13270 [Spirochaetia bacterium]|nr:hypothetical protein [Spirochaetia bacterium]
MKSIRYAPEWRRYKDPVTGTALLQWTSGNTMNHHFYFTNPPVSADGRTGFLVSYRNGFPNIYAIDLTSGELVQITDRTDLNPFSPAPSADGNSVFFTARNCLWKLDTRHGETTALASFASSRLGICSLNRDGSLLAMGVRHDDWGELVVVDTVSGNLLVSSREEEVGHVQFCPIDDTLLLFSGSIGRRIWCHDRRTGRSRRIVAEGEGEWFVHESWIGGSRKILYVRWPHALLMVDSGGGEPVELLRINAWHPRSDAEGKMIVFDTNHPDRGLKLLDIRSGSLVTLCYPGATLRGSQWRFDRPSRSAGMDTSIIRSGEPEQDLPPSPDHPESLYGPQWTHPHPSFTVDARSVVFTSDRERYSHVYSVTASS